MTLQKKSSAPFSLLKTISTFLFFLAISSSTLFAQSTVVKPNIKADEFTEKGATNTWSEGTEVPNLEFNDVFNKKFKLYDMLDKPVVIEFSNMRIQQSKKNKSYLKSFYKQFDINILSISTDEHANDVRAFVKSKDIPWSTVHDNGKMAGSSSFAEANFYGQPAFVIIMPDKTIKKIFYAENEIGKVGVTLQQYFAK